MIKNAVSVEIITYKTWAVVFRADSQRSAWISQTPPPLRRLSITSKGSFGRATGVSKLLYFILCDLYLQRNKGQCFHEPVVSLLSPLPVLWGLLNNAGVFGDLGPVEWSSKEDFIKVFEVNVYGSIRMTRAFLPLLKLSRGRLVFTTSIIGRMASYGTGTYAASKFALEAFGDACRYSVIA